MKKLILIDGYGFVFRAFHSLPPLTRPSDGMPIGAVYGFTNMLVKLLADNESSHIAVVLDNGTKNFRHELYPSYKANRPVPPQELVSQFPIIREVIGAFDLIAIEKEGYEADDLLASYARYAKDEGYEVVIVSSDKDLMQLLANGIQMYDAMKDRMITKEVVFEKFGVSPDKIREVLALIGDSSDNIPGVRGIGPKTASELVNAYGSLKGVYEHLGEITQEKRRQMLIEGQSNAELSYELVRLKDDVQLDYSLDELKFERFDAEKLSAFAQAQGFKSLVAKLQTKHGQHHSALEFKPLTDYRDLSRFIDEIFKAGTLAFLANEHKFFLSFNDRNFVIMLNNDTKGTQASLFAESEKESTVTQIFKILEPVMCSDAVLKITINSKWLYKLNPAFTNIDDIAIIAYVIETGRDSTDLDALIHECSEGYKEHDSHALMIIHDKLKNKLVHEKLVSVYERIDRSMPKVVAQMEEVGVRLNTDYLSSLSSEFTEKLKALESKIFVTAGVEFNIGSPKQMGEILFEKLKIPGGKKTKAGAYTTSAKVLETLSDAGYDIAGLILDWRGYAKLISTYTDALPRSVNPISQRVHSNFLLTATSTGRFSSTEPNLQNIPIRTEEGQKIRSAFVASPGNKIISADYSQIELRLLAHYADIKTLKDAFKQGYDIHAITASQMFSVPIDKVDSAMRRQAKTINFGIIYGISAFGLAKRLDIPRERAKQYIDEYFKQYPGIKAYMDKTIEFARKHGYVLSVFGRKCIINGINDGNFTLRSFAERAAINAPLQSSAADIIKKAMASLPIEVRKYMILQIHDELLFDVPEAEVDQVSKIVKQTMESVIDLSTKLKVEVSYGDTWAQAH
jgi:DNA polymerase-1